MSVVGIDIGGANLKASDGERSVSMQFPLWERPEQLPQALQELLSQFHPYGPIAATMTGELADCFPTRAAGVAQIIEAIQLSFPQRQLSVWQSGGEFFSANEAIEFPELVAAANWHALATWVGRAAPTSIALMIDIGSTTTDIIPIDCGIPSSSGTTDLGRLQAGELVYSGVRRTPLFALAKSVLIDGRNSPLAAEVFATTLDLALLLGEVSPDPQDLNTANGRPATVVESRQRVARCVCSDTDQLSESDVLDIVRQCRNQQLEQLVNATRQVLAALPETPQTVFVSGEGESLANSLLKEGFPELAATERLSMKSMLGPIHSQAACAFALAKLGTERL